ncbi:uncharacterized protein LOC105649920 isoform X1 [Jatropha curcas]|uniref:uncharacterized protein LOC105649920 isoform X1 n=1 Tax=Jatropha curcas TaxID=180498 RepID=UPI0005FB7416|nr:uncharacterized protein LOC105649920 isoform X1 [Jatropha curcas]
MDSETASSVDEQVGAAGASVGAGADTRGRHRILAEVKRVEQEIKCLEIASECSDLTRSFALRNNWSCKPIMGSMVRRASGISRMQMLDTLI